MSGENMEKKEIHYVAMIVKLLTEKMKSVDKRQTKILLHVQYKIKHYCLNSY